MRLSNAISRLLLTIIFALIVTGSVLGCAKHPVKDGSNTNWLGYCEVTSDCKGAGACICGLCTRTCNSGAECIRGGCAASCVEPAEGSATTGCATVIKDADERICLPDCVDSEDCGTSSTCIRGACWPITEGIIDIRGETDASSPLFSIDVDAAMDFSQPVSLPEPETAIEGSFDPSLLLGTWLGEEDRRNYTGSSIDPIELRFETDSDSRALIGSITFRCGEECTDAGYAADLSPLD